MDTYTTIWNRVLLRVPAAGPDLAQDLVKDAFNQLVERRQWTWLMKSGCFYPPKFGPFIGTVSAVGGSPTVTGIGTSFNQSLVGKQMRIGGLTFPTYTISQVLSPTALMLDKMWVGPDQINVVPEVFQCYFPVPADFDYFYSVVNPAANYKLNHNVTQAEIDRYDPQRSQAGPSWAVSFYENTKNYQGVVEPTLRIAGSGPIPVSGTNQGYSYPADSIYSFQITQGGPVGVSQFQWQQDGGTTSGIAVTTSSFPINLSNGVQLTFPAADYVLWDVFVISCKANAVASVPRYELWPRPIETPYTYPYMYASRVPPLSEEQPQLPPPIARRGDVLVEMALTNLALWPGTSTQPNPYRDVPTSQLHRNNAEKLIYELEKKDDEIGIRDLVYSDLQYSGPWNDGSWQQTHAIYTY